MVGPLEWNSLALRDDSDEGVGREGPVGCRPPSRSDTVDFEGGVRRRSLVLDLSVPIEERQTRQQPEFVIE
jgi:hypothetical protein